MSQSQVVPLAPQDAVSSEPVCGLALLDREDRFEWLNEPLAGLLGMAADSVTGRGVDELPADRHAWFRDTAGRFQWHDLDGHARWLQPERHPAGDKTLLVLRDVTAEQDLLTENRRLRRQIEELKLTDDLTGLPNRRAITQALELQISRSRRYRNPLSIVLVHAAVPDEQIERLQGDAAPLVLGVSQFLRDRLRWVDQIGRWEDNIFLLVLPETKLADARALVDKIDTELSDRTLPAPLDTLNPALSFGLGVWHKGDDLRTLLQAATRDLVGD